MVKKGARVIELTRKVGQPGRVGTVIDIRGESIEVKWADGHTSITSRQAVVPKTKANEASARQG